MSQNAAGITDLVHGRYELGRQLGSGYFGEVYLAHDRNLGHDLALKLIRNKPHEATSLLREAAYLKALESPYVVRVENAAIDGDIGYLATQLATGSAEDELEPFGMRPDRVLMFARQALIGLEACHHHGLVHGDVKPGNLFIYDDRAAIGDFGAAGRMDEHGRTRAMGDPQIRAPELLKGGSATIASDIFAMGVSLYRLTTGQWPVAWRTDFGDLKARVLTRNYVDIHDTAPHLPLPLVWAIRKAMDVDLAKRPATANKMAQAVARIDLGRNWSRTVSHADHSRCWQDDVGGPRRTVCLIPSDGTFDIEVRRIAGAQTRLKAQCRARVSAARVATQLRQIFRQA